MNRIHALAIPILLALSACASTQQGMTLKNDRAQANMIISTVDTEFKSNLLTGIIERYKDQCNIEVIDISMLEEVDESQYDVLVIMDTTRVWTLFNLQIGSFMDRVEDPHKVVIHLTATIAWSFEYREIDAITSASSKSSEVASLKRIFARVDELLVKEVSQP